MGDVWKHSDAAGNDLLLLLAMADHADDRGICWPSIHQLAIKTRVSESTVKRSIKTLVDLGELKIEEAGGTFGTRRLANRYRVLRGKRKYQGDQPDNATGGQNEPRFKMDPVPIPQETRGQNEPGSHSYEPGPGVTAMDPGRGSQLWTPNRHEEPPKETSTKTSDRAEPKDIPQPPEKSVVVVSSFEGNSFPEEQADIAGELDTLATEFAITEPQARQLFIYAKREGIEFVREKAAVVRSEPRDNLARAFMAALKGDWKMPKRTPKPERNIPVPSKEERPPEPAADFSAELRWWQDATEEEKEAMLARKECELYRHKMRGDPAPGNLHLSAIRLAWSRQPEEMASA
jgi:hypothetical protein